MYSGKLQTRTVKIFNNKILWIGGAVLNNPKIIAKYFGFPADKITSSLLFKRHL